MGTVQRAWMGILAVSMERHESGTQNPRWEGYIQEEEMNGMSKRGEVWKGGQLDQARTISWSGAALGRDVGSHRTSKGK
jgi:hypothetical protein